MKRGNVYFIVVSIIMLVMLATTSCAPKSEVKGTISASGAFALYPMMNVWADEFKKLNPGVEFDVSAGGAGKGMTDVLTGAVDIGMISRSITADEEAKGAYWVGVTKDAVFPVVNSKNPVLADILAKGIQKNTFIDIFITGKITTWGQVVGKPEITDAIHVFTRSDSAGAADAWAKYLGNKTQADLKGIGVNGDPGITDAIAKDPLGIGYNNLAYAFDPTSGDPVAGVSVAPIDANENGEADTDEVMTTKSKAIEMVASNKYPSPPARVLYFATKGKPTGIVQAFIKWILTDGQKFVSEGGYVSLPQDQLDASLKKVQ